MAVGRTLLLKKNDVVLAGLRSASLSWSGESIDLTTGERRVRRELDALRCQEKLDFIGDGLKQNETRRR